MNDTYTADSIQVLEGLEAVRVRPAMYIGSTTQRGLNHLIYEIMDNSVDECVNGFGSHIWVTLNEDGSCTIKDEGRGIPVDLHKSGVPAERVIFTTLHAGGKFNNNSYKSSGGLHGVGSSVVNALSDWLEVKVKRNGKIYQDRYQKGIPDDGYLVDNQLKVIGKCNPKETGTEVSFYPDSTIFETITFKSSDIKNRLHETAYLNPNLIIEFKDNRPGSEEEIIFHEPEGMIKYVSELNKEEDIIHDSFSFDSTFEGDKGPIEVEVTLQYIQSTQEKIIGFCNNICTQEGGTHLTGLKSSLTNLMNTYARQLNILKEKDPNFTGTDVRSGLTAVVAVKHPDPIFEGQTKTKLDNPDVQKAVTSIATKELTLYFDKNLETLKKILTVIDKSAKLRKSEAKTRQNLFSSKKKFSFDSNGKLANCESRNPSECELFIVEGDSAAGSSKMARNRKYQAILPIRGKILNVEKAPISRILANGEIKTLIYALNCGFLEGYGNDFDISKLRYDKIIIMTDADTDGNHITTLLLTIFYRLLPELIYQGHVYVAVPPLYKVIPKKGEEKYLYDDSELEEYRKTHNSSGFHLKRFKGLGEMNPEQLKETTMNPETRILKRVVIDDEIKAANVTANLIGTNVEPRKRFIVENAQLANLDI